MTNVFCAAEFHLGNAEAWQTFTDTISQPLEPLGIEKMIQVPVPIPFPHPLSLHPSCLSAAAFITQLEGSQIH